MFTEPCPPNSKSSVTSVSETWAAPWYANPRLAITYSQCSLQNPPADLSFPPLYQAANLQKHLTATGQPPLVVFNRSASRAEPLRALGAVVAASLADVSHRADVVFTCLSNDAAVLETYEQLLEDTVEGKVFLEQSTVSSDTTAKVAEMARKKGATLLGSPIMGPPASAVSAQLVIILAGGTVEIRDRISPYLVPILGRALIPLGNDERDASKLKLTGNFFISSMVEMLAEGLTLGEAAVSAYPFPVSDLDPYVNPTNLAHDPPGLGQHNVQKLINAVFAGTPLVPYAERMVSESYDIDLAAGERAQFSISGAKKDVSHILNLAKNHGAKLPISEVIFEHLQQAGEEKGDIDFSGIVGVLRKDAGLPFNLKKK
ncbi:hypothetical protein BC938DRAFT_475926 [Jimgerdemannia flammicorona]|uniref:6-phosphogluconate dehydrogenase NADP-binding domain-containing protein n=1 Tax=Jimgerdemannia flammicorona TaxID=994334 RepID=A0A433QR43_9FUNG|nr:hypothetical protein BC938DRAFT_475926 [Jimgerdemannia flammicorona]